MCHEVGRVLKYSLHIRIILVHSFRARISDGSRRTCSRRVIFSWRFHSILLDVLVTRLEVWIKGQLCLAITELTRPSHSAINFFLVNRCWVSDTLRVMR